MDREYVVDRLLQVVHVPLEREQGFQAVAVPMGYTNIFLTPRTLEGNCFSMNFHHEIAAEGSPTLLSTVS